MTKPLLVLAAGMGSRYGGLKQIDPIGPGGETIIDYSVHDAMRAGFDELVFVIRHELENTFRDAVGSRFENRIAVKYVFQELDRPTGVVVPPHRTKPWGTGHAILMAAGAIQQPFGVINADDFYGARSFQVLGEHLQSGDPSYAMVGFILRNTVSEFGSVARGVCRLADGHLESVQEIVGIEKHGTAARYQDPAGQFRTLRGDEIVSMNMWGFHPSLFGHLREQWLDFLAARGSDDTAEFFIPAVVNHLIQREKERVKVLPTTSLWFGVTYREDRPRVADGIRELVRSGEYPERLWP